MIPVETSKAQTAQDCLAGGGEMGALMRATNWSKTSIGPVESWPLALRMMVSVLLANRFPMLLWWGPEYVSIYNDAYIPVLGKKHPKALGQPVRECWSEIWHILQPLIDTPFHGGEPTWMDDLALELNRYGFAEETHFTVAYSPVPDETAPGAIGGVLATVTEITGKIIGERRLRVLRDLGARSSEAKTAEQACSIAASTLEQHPKDVPFALVYLFDPAGRTASLEGRAGVAPGDPVSPLRIAIADRRHTAWPAAEMLRHETTLVVEDLPAKFSRLPPGPWSDAPHAAAVLPIRSNIAHQPAGFLVLGLSARLRFDDSYRTFCDLVAAQVATAIANARAYEEERRRAEALAEIDRAKTLFFSNVSHEFRTPLTLMLGPIEEMIAHGDTRPELDLAHRNALRLLKLVNTLLDFSRIEAGRIQACYQPADLAAITAELASVFRSAIEKAGLRLLVDCPPLGEPVYVDRDMWEKIVLNLLSNAFKFTLSGDIEVKLRRAGAGVELSVRDTGSGIDAAELPRVFERFHRVKNDQARTQEGSGIGLALVQELARLHGGSVRVESRVGQGSTFSVSIPLGSGHLPGDRLGAAPLSSTALGARPFVEEALRWLPASADSSGAPAPAAALADELSSWLARPTQASGARVLIVDDNRDLRDYLCRLLENSYRVSTAADGAAALEMIRADPPDLVVADVMMPRLDGFGLLQAIRAGPAARALPVILLSARAGEESRVEGLNAGADDYLVKPFSARELRARIASHLAIANLRREAADTEHHLRLEADAERRRWRDLFTQAPAGIAMLSGPDHVFEFANPEYLRLTGRDLEPLIGKSMRDAFPGARADEVIQNLDRVYRTGQPVSGREIPATLDVQRTGSPEQRFYNYGFQPNRNARGEIQGVLLYVVDVTDQVRSRKRVEESERQLHNLANSIPQLVWMADGGGRVFWYNRRWYEYTGSPESKESSAGKLIEALHPLDAREYRQGWTRAVATGDPLEIECRVFERASREYRWHLALAMPMRDGADQVVRWFGTLTDIDGQKRTEQQLRRANEDLRDFAYAASHDLQEPLRMVTSYSQLLVERAPETQRSPEAEMFCRFITQGTQRMRLLLEDLLAYTLVGAQDDAPLQPVPLSAALEAARANLKAGIEESDAVLTSDPLPTVEGHPAHYIQLFQNLISNAIKYRSPAAPRIHVSAARDGAEHIISVHDNGIGIAPEYHQRIFGIFKRLHGNSIPGTGIGLALCQRVVERYGGRIWVESAPDEGATFSFALPAH